uniref:Uncharacterized protein n=1 Tax=Arundo donax TaxID=35708 RepID=A0A0A9C2E9_ARUDO
MESSVAAAA